MRLQGDSKQDEKQTQAIASGAEESPEPLSLEMAIRGRHTLVVKDLLKNFAKLPKPLRSSDRDRLYHDCGDPNQDCSEEGFNMLKLACADPRNHEIVELLLKNGAKVDAKSGHVLQTTPTQAEPASSDKKEESLGDAKKVKLSRREIDTAEGHKDGHHAFIVGRDRWAPERDNPIFNGKSQAYINAYIDAYPISFRKPLDLKDVAEMTPLMLAIAQYKQFDSFVNVTHMKHLSERKEGYTVAERTIELLLKYKANPNLKYSNGRTILSYVVENQIGILDVFKMLLACQANPNLANDDGTTPLFLATKRNYNVYKNEKRHCDLWDVRILLESGANPFQLNELASDKLLFEEKLNPASTDIDDKTKSRDEKDDHSCTWTFWEWAQNMLNDPNVDVDLKAAKMNPALTKQVLRIHLEEGTDGKELKLLAEAFEDFLKKHPNIMRADFSAKTNPELGRGIRTFIKNILSVLKLRGYRKDGWLENNGKVFFQWLNSTLSKLSTLTTSNHFLADNLLAIRGQINYMNGSRDRAVEDWMNIKDLSNIPQNLCAMIGEGICNRAKKGNIENYSEMMTRGLQFLKQAGLEMTPEALKLYVIDDEGEWEKMLGYDDLAKEKEREKEEAKEQKAHQKTQTEKEETAKDKGKGKDKEEKTTAQEESAPPKFDWSVISDKSADQAAKDSEVEVPMSLDEEEEKESKQKDGKESKESNKNKEEKNAAKKVAQLTSWHQRIDAKIEMLSYGWDSLNNAMKEFEKYVIKNKRNCSPLFNQTSLIGKQCRITINGLNP